AVILLLSTLWRRSPHASGGAVAFEGGDGGIIIAQFPENLVTMLPEQGGHGDARRRSGKLDGIPRGDVAPAHGMLDLHDHVAGEEMRISQHLARVETGPAG